MNWYQSILSIDFPFKRRRNLKIRKNFNWYQSIVSIDFPFKPRRNLKIRKNFNWYQYIFNCFFLNLEETSRFERISIDINVFSIDFPFKPGRYFKIHKDVQLISIDFPFAPRRNLKISKDFNWYQSTLNWISFYCKPKRNLKGPRGLIN